MRSVNERPRTSTPRDFHENGDSKIRWPISPAKNKAFDRFEPSAARRRNSGTLTSFAPVSQADYVGWNGGAIGAKGHDDSILSDYEIVDDAHGATNAVPTIDEDGEVCLHAEIEPFEDESSRGACTDCGEEFAINTDSLRGDSVASAEEDAGGVDTVLEKMANVAWSAKRLRRRAGAVFRPTF